MMYQQPVHANPEEIAFGHPKMISLNVFENQEREDMMNEEV